MPQLNIPDWTTARLVSVTPRQEHHGESLVVALTMRFRLSGPNELLDQFSPDLRRAIFAGKDELQGIRALPGVDEPTPHLRHKLLEGVRFSLPLKTEGATVLVDYGIEGDEKPITMGTSKADKVTAAGYDGGSSDIEFNVSTSDVDSQELGIICGQLGADFPIKVLAPKEQAKTTDAASDPNQLTLDGSTGNEKGETSPARLAAEAEFREPERGSDWPFPRTGDASPAFPNAVDGDDDGQDAGEHLAEDVAKNGPEPSAKTPAQIKRESRFPSQGAKYRDPASGQTWSGRGLKPKWLTVALAAGKTLADFETVKAD